MTASRRTIARAEALFVSPVPTGTLLTPDRLDAEVVAAIGRHGGVPQCAAAMAAEFGDQPETSVRRMRWVLSLVAPPSTAACSAVSVVASDLVKGAGDAQSCPAL